MGALVAPNAIPLVPNAEFTVEPKAGVLVAPNDGALSVTNAGVLAEAGLLEAPNAPPNPKTGAFIAPNAIPLVPNAEFTVEPKAGVLVAPNDGALSVTNARVLVEAGLLEAPNAPPDPKMEAFVAPNAIPLLPNAAFTVELEAGVLVAPNDRALSVTNARVLVEAGLLEAPNAPPDPKMGAFVAPNAIPLVPNAEFTVEPKAGVLVAPNDGALSVTNARVLVEAGLLEAPNAPPDPKMGALVAPNAIPLVPNAAFTVEPEAGVLVAPNDGALSVTNLGVLVEAGLLEAPNAPPDPKMGALVAPNAIPLVPNAAFRVETMAGVLVALNDGALSITNIGVLAVPMPGALEPKPGVELALNSD
ncbi:hypothetical protein NL676_009880 [Syzygium grande]|nr:hypothetical protein NL676_009880 [Syzygium grande]